MSLKECLYQAKGARYYRRMYKAIGKIPFAHLVPKLRYNLRNAHELNRVSLYYISIQKERIPGVEERIDRKPKLPFPNSRESVTNAELLLNSFGQLRNEEEMKSHLLESSEMWLQYIKSLSELKPETVKHIFREK
ncbi:hypothetical protein BB560_000951 [Smittium megazygosporum]|uniref:Uncharacterized protein n=1 Tax=Smittium megazygosporum TaxID=133381 RepID=A0A2T9ZJ55_9FUNG|nr:hypothetical protein BB560_000951 [Smittium megazygosporum]